MVTSSLTLPSTPTANSAANFSIACIVIETLALLVLRVFNIPLALPSWMTGATRHVYDVDQLITATHSKKLRSSRSAWAEKLVAKIDASYPNTAHPESDTNETTHRPSAPVALIMNQVRSLVLRIGGLEDTTQLPVLTVSDVMGKLSQLAIDGEECIICTVPLTQGVEDEGEAVSSAHAMVEMNPSREDEQGGNENCVSVSADGCNNSLPPLWVTPCGHFFHKQCLKTWMEEKLTCPLCRMPLPEP
jgi:hypothetical protein